MNNCTHYFTLSCILSVDLIDVVKKDYGIEGGKMYLRKIVSVQS
jgi:hypothetical protein